MLKYTRAKYHLWMAKRLVRKLKETREKLKYHVEKGEKLVAELEMLRDIEGL